MSESLKLIMETAFSFYPNKNQLKDIERLLFEIMRRENLSLTEVISPIKENPLLEKYQGRNKFFIVKDLLIKQRFPLTSRCQKIDTKKVFLTKVQPPLSGNWPVKKEFHPLKIFVEKAVKDSYLVENFKNNFPGVEIEELSLYRQYLKTNKFSVSHLKKPIVFIIKENWDFIKPCPCTKGHLRCGYWIFNLGFGCPYDCSYCFLQKYTNAPGIILPANLDDFFARFDAFAKNLAAPIRIGSGEFCDSLALDHITQYSSKLIAYFRNKNLFFELKTKSAQISNLLTLSPAPNIIVSWSLNPESITDTEELGAPSLTQRLTAAQTVQTQGYKLGFHFDPIIYSENWQQLYSQVVDKLYAMLKPPFAWISLGTLRANRELKAITESRFPKSNIFYGELFLGEDKKLRYPQFLREDIYKKMIAKIRRYDAKTPLYLCMENEDVWQKTLPANMTPLPAY